MFWKDTDIGIDLGTATILVYVKGRGIVIHEPSVVAIDRDTGEVRNVGSKAREMIGRTPGNIVAIRPLRNGVIANYDITEVMLKHYMTAICGRRPIIKPRVVVCIPTGITSVERRAVYEAAMQAGAKNVYLIDEPMAAAIGSGIKIYEANGSMIIDIGGGTTGIAVISLNGIVVSESLRVGGDMFDDAIIKHIKKMYNLMIGERSAEEIKIAIGSAYPGLYERSVEIKGRDLVTGLPRTINFTTSEVYEAITEPIAMVINSVRKVLEETPPELASDIMNKGIVMTGGGALLKGLDRLLTEETGIPAYIAEDPVSCVAKGAGLFLERFDEYSEILNYSRLSG